MRSEVVVAIIVTTLIVWSCAERTTNQNTLRDCATRGYAFMAGGGMIECNVKRKEK